MALPVLYEIAKDYRDALEELTEIEDEAVVDTLEGLKGTLEAKSKNIIKYTQNLKSTIEAMKEAEKNMAQRRKRLEKKSENINPNNTWCIFFIYNLCNYKSRGKAFNL